MGMYKRVGSLLLSVFLLTTFLWFATAKRTYAYIDLGTGSYLLQMLLAGLFVSMFALKVFWQRVMATMSTFLSKIPVFRKGDKYSRDKLDQ